MKTRHLLLFLGLTLFVACKKDNDTPPNNTTDETPAELLSVLDSLPDAADVTPENILLPNGMTLKAYLQEIDSAFAKTWLRNNDPYAGMTPTEARTLLVARISAAAWNLSNRSLYKYNDEGPGKPKQYGLAYSWGSKVFDVRQKPPGGSAACDHSIYGLDCSGFMYQIFKAANIAIPEGNADAQRAVSTLNNAVHNASPALKSINFVDYGKVTDTKTLRIGDILYWKDADGKVVHIGIVLANQIGQKIVYQSIGRNSAEPGQCDQNLGLDRGPRGIYFDDPTGKAVRNAFLVRAEVPPVCACASGSTLCNAPPDEASIRFGLLGFVYKPGNANKAEAKSMLQYLCADIQHEYTFPDGTIYVCGVFPNGAEVTLWTPTYGGKDRYGVRYGQTTDNHSYFSSNATYFELIK